MKDAATGRTICGHHREAAMRRLGLRLTDADIRWIEPRFPVDHVAA